MDIIYFARLDQDIKTQLLKKMGLLIDSYSENNETTCIYFLDSFFVEVVSRENGVPEIFPFQRGYKIC